MSTHVPDITPSIIAEYEALENSPVWFLGFQGDLMQKEGAVWQWVEQSANRALMGLGQIHQAVFAQDPVLVKDLYVVLQQWFIRGFYMGIRRYTSEIAIGVGPMNPLSDPGSRKKKTPPVGADGKAWSENAELDLSDFDSPRVEEIQGEDPEPEGTK